MNKQNRNETEPTNLKFIEAHPREAKPKHKSNGTGSEVNETERTQNQTETETRLGERATDICPHEVLDFLLGSWLKERGAKSKRTGGKSEREKEGARERVR